MKRLPIAVGVVVLVGMLAVRGHTQAPDEVRGDNVKTFMRVKLERAQQVLEGLTLEDHQKIAEGAQELSLLSLASNWQVIQTPKYADHSQDFRRTADRLTKAGKDQNLEGATLAFVELTMKCVNCHKYIREVRAAKVDLDLLPEGPITPEASQ